MTSMTEYLQDILDELKVNAAHIEEEELQAASDIILHGNRIFVAGAGRSGFAARAFANRLMHLGKCTYFVGEPTTPAIGKGDVLIIGSGSGETGSLVHMAKKAVSLGAKLVTLTIHPEAAIGKNADAVICIPGATPKSELDDTCVTIQPMGNAFEQMCWLIYDVLIKNLMEQTNADEAEMFSRHANLE